MLVTIKERQYEYASDYPEGWQFSKGDYFKFPVQIGINKCFIKRFKIKSPDNISGWPLLVALRGKYAANLPRIHDIIKTSELDTDIYYVFYEFIDGETLHQLTSKHSEVNLYRLTDDLLNALLSLHKNGFWFSDFDERNIFCNHRGIFYLVDIDSTQPSSATPDIEMWGNKDYWVLVFDFYKNILAKENFVPANVPGSLLNIIQVIFLILRLKIYYSNFDQDYRELFSHLPAYLNRISPDFKTLFQNIIHEQAPSSTYAEAAAILLKREVLPLSATAIHDIVAAGYTPVKIPVINMFAVHNPAEKLGNNYVVIRENTLTLKWDVENASNIELYEGDVLIHHFTEDERSIEIKSVPAHVRQIQYTLLASEGSRKVSSEPINVNFQYNIPVIHDFMIRGYKHREGDVYLLKNRQPFELFWNTSFASLIEITRNGEVLHHIEKGAENLHVNESYNNNDNLVTYELKAYNPEGAIVAETLSLRVLNPQPVIHSFYIGQQEKNENQRYQVESGSSFVLHWKISEADKVEIFKDDLLVKTVDGTHSSVELSEQVFDTLRKRFLYSIVVTNDEASTRSEPVEVEVVRPEPAVPVLKVNRQKVKSGHPFTLSWQTMDAGKLSLLKDGSFLQEVSPMDHELQLTENGINAEDRKYEYRLVAQGSGIDVSSNPVFVTITNASPVPWIKYLVWAGVLLAIVALVFVLRGLFKGTSNDGFTISRVEPTSVYQDSTINIYGNELANGKVEVLFDNLKSRLDRVSGEVLVARVPSMVNKRSAPDSINLKILNKGRVIYSEMLPYIPNISQGPATATLPMSMRDIWKGAQNSFITFDADRKLLYYSADGKENFRVEAIHKVDYDNVALTYHVVTYKEGVFRLYLLKNVTPSSVELATCPNTFNNLSAVNVAGCSEFEKLAVYYDQNPSVIYLPIATAASNQFDDIQNQKLRRVYTASPAKDFTVTLYHSNRYLQPPSAEEVRAMLPSNGIAYQFVEAKTPRFSISTPFQRNFITLTPTIPQEDKAEVLPDCNRTFTSIQQANEAESPLLICNLNLSAISVTAIPRDVYRYRNLRVLNLGSNPVPSSEIARFKRIMPKCRVISTAKPPEDKNVGVPAGRKTLGYIRFTLTNELDLISILLSSSVK